MRTSVTLAALALSLGTLTACGGGDDAYCKELKADQAYFENFSSSSPDFDKLDEALDQIHSLAENAPEEVADDWKVLDDAFATVEKALADAGVSSPTWPRCSRARSPRAWTPAKARRARSKLQELSGAKFENAAKAIEKHAKDTCDVIKLSDPRVSTAQRH